MNQQTCPSCKTETSSNSYFCPNCGKKLQNKPLSTSIRKQIIVYLISLLLPPLGFFYGYRYLKQKNNQATGIGIFAIILTTISLFYSIWFFINFITSFNQTLNQQLQMYKNLGY